MKIEKVNENQIRCTLTREDLASRELKISELAYGTEKAKSLFRDMMQQANFEFGFEAEDIPLMIEAIPLNADCIVLIITKVEDPDELDTRFSKFAPFKGSKSSDTVEIDGADNIIDIFQKLCESKLKNIPQKTEEKKDSTTAPLSEEAQDNSHISVLLLPLRKKVMRTVMRALQTRFWICSAVSRAKTIPQTLLKLLLRPLPRKVTVYVPACSVWNL